MSKMSDINPRRGTAASLLRHLRAMGPGELNYTRRYYLTGDGEPGWDWSWPTLRTLYRLDSDAENLVAHFRATGRVREVCAAEDC